MTPGTLARLERAVKNFSNQLQCAICLCSYDNPVSFPCNHCFCEECIHRALELKAMCPICKAPAKKRRLRYDTTVQELLRAIEMLTAPPIVDNKEEKVCVQAETTEDVAKTATPILTATSERRSSPRRGQCNSQNKTRTFVDVWMSAGSSEPSKRRKKSPVGMSERRSSPRQMQMKDQKSRLTTFSLSSEVSGNDPSRVERSKDKTEQSRMCPLRPDLDGKIRVARTKARHEHHKEEAQNEVDVVVPETQVEVIEQDQQQQQIQTRQRRLYTDKDTRLVGIQRKPASRRQKKSATNISYTTVDADDAGRSISQVSRKHRPSAPNDVAFDAGNPKKLSHSTEGIKSALAYDSLMKSPPDGVIEKFQVGDLVNVIERQWVGINKLGGAARITKVCGDGFYAVKFVMGCGDNRVPESFIRRPDEELISDMTPSCAAKKRRLFLSTSPDAVSIKNTSTKSNGKHSGMVFLCSGFKDRQMHQINEWANMLGAEVVKYWSNNVTHLIAKCVSGDNADEDGISMEDSDFASSPRRHQDEKYKPLNDSKSGRWVKIRSLKYLKALVGGRWIVSEEWLRACAEHGTHVSEINYEADGHWKGRKIFDAVKRSRLKREKLLQLSSPTVNVSTIGTMLFADFCFCVVGDFLPPMPPIEELNTLICIGGGKLIAILDEIPDEMQKRENHSRKLIIISDKINPVALRQQTRQLKAQPQVKAVSSVTIVNYLWLINSISEAKLRDFPL
ncbi:hypothetical protein PsorP6_014428 [Peronosclerospora sorghi]|uniref:Uncharacterized protein n=1 Tax=Peronosclerospora sorghi TaxID=230839 RepID=A0ACC0VGR4_9STRA|nr:hypothetical protein PsorP6_014428 [Peronosclerospora sorghi]